MADFDQKRQNSDFIGKVSEKITKNYLPIPHIKVKTPENWIVHIFWMELNFDIP